MTVSLKPVWITQGDPVSNKKRREGRGSGSRIEKRREGERQRKTVSGKQREGGEKKIFGVLL